ncbi:unnamed protein product [Periconia digitata]|uniref:Thioester reductase (TE) domain-containing protein n=1 Tax=Periconia digitata TaxID=1303443 RepID=A0A9W4U951_9PLEO|nr:unnamed protein product [Periconia digitata]
MGYELVEGDRRYSYAASKYTAERMVAAARWRGAKASVYRLPFITASLATSHFRLNRGDFLHNFLSGCLELGAFPSIDQDLSAVLPVDYVADTIVNLIKQNATCDGFRDYDFIDSSPISFDHFFHLFGAALPGQEVVPFAKWNQRASSYAANHLASPLARIITLLDSVTDASGLAAMLSGPKCSRENVLGGDHYPAPAITKDFVAKYVTHIFSTATTLQNKD